MNCLITGANGFLGKAIATEVSKEYKLFSLSRTSGDYKVFLEKDIPFFERNFDIVIHAAGKAHSVPRTELEKEEFYRTNVIGTRNLLSGLEISSLPNQFVFISSVAVYGREIGTDIKESDHLDAKDPYGLSKIEAEDLILDWCKLNNVVCTILRLPLLVGKNPPGNLGAMLSAIRKGYYFNIDGGKARKSMVLIKDVASFITIVSSVGGIYNLTDRKHPSFSELSLAISKKKKLSLSIGLAKIIGKVGDILGDKAPITSMKIKKITSDLTFDDSKAHQLLNWNPESVLDYLNRERL